MHICIVIISIGLIRNLTYDTIILVLDLLGIDLLSVGAVALLDLTALVYKIDCGVISSSFAGIA